MYFTPTANTPSPAPKTSVDTSPATRNPCKTHHHGLRWYRSRSGAGKTVIATWKSPVVVDAATYHLAPRDHTPAGKTAMRPQDIKLGPDGRTYYIADSQSGGLSICPTAATAVTRHIATGKVPAIVANPAGGSPDIGNVPTADRWQ